MMSAPRCLGFGLLVLCLGITISAYAEAYPNAGPAGTGGITDPLISNGSTQNLSHASSSVPQISSSSSLSAAQPGLPGTKFSGNGGFGGGDLKPILPPLPPTPTPIPEPSVFVDLGAGLAAFATIWKVTVRRSA